MDTLHWALLSVLVTGAGRWWCERKDPRDKKRPFGPSIPCKILPLIHALCVVFATVLVANLVRGHDALIAGIAFVSLLPIGFLTMSLGCAWVDSLACRALSSVSLATLVTLAVMVWRIVARAVWG